MMKTVNEGLGGAKITKVLGREEHFLRAFSENADRYAEASQFRQLMLDVPRIYLETAAITGLLAVAAMLVLREHNTRSIIPTLTLLAVAIVRMTPSFNRITTSLASIRYGRFALEAVHADLMHFTVASTASSNGTRCVFERAITLDDVSYRYPGAARDSLSDVSLEIPRGSVVGFVGPTGAGKTTIVDVILGLLQPTRGQLLVDGRDAQSQIKEWQNQIGYVPQDVYLMDDTIRHNIAYGLTGDDIDESAIARAVRAAQLEEFVATLPSGLETMVGERGVRLSGGQRQRIGIARALYKNPSVLLLDEATSSLDNETEAAVMGAVEALRGSRTIIIVAHRMSTVRACDRLFVLRNGELVGSGSYESLLDSSQEFRRLTVRR